MEEKKIFKIIECSSDCPLRQNPAYDSQWCNFYGEDLDHFHVTIKNRKPNFCKVKRVIVEEAKAKENEPKVAEDWIQGEPYE